MWAWLRRFCKFWKSENITEFCGDQTKDTTTVERRGNPCSFCLLYLGYLAATPLQHADNKTLLAQKCSHNRCLDGLVLSTRQGNHLPGIADNLKKFRAWNSMPPALLNCDYLSPHSNSDLKLICFLLLSVNLLTNPFRQRRSSSIMALYKFCITLLLIMQGYQAKYGNDGTLAKRPGNYSCMFCCICHIWYCWLAWLPI